MPSKDCWSAAKAKVCPLLRELYSALTSRASYPSRTFTAEDALQVQEHATLVFTRAMIATAKELVFVVNKNTLRYEGSALEKILEQQFDDPGRQDRVPASTERMELIHGLKSLNGGASGYRQRVLPR